VNSFTQLFNQLFKYNRLAKIRKANILTKETYE